MKASSLVVLTVGLMIGLSWNLASTLAAGAAPTATAPAVAAPAAPLQLLTAKDLAAKKSSAKATIVNMWATWCEPCKQEMPEILAFRKKNAARGVQLFLVDADSPDDQKSASEFLAKLGVDFPTYHLGEDPDQFMKPFADNWPATIPTTLVFDKSGKRVGYWIGRIKLKELEKTVEKALKAP